MALTFSANLTSNLTDIVNSNTPSITRSGTTTVINSDGLLESVSANTAAFHYDSGVNVGLMMEGASTNEAEYSEDAGGASWTTSNTTVNSTSTNDPYGVTSTTVEVQADAANGTLLQTLTHASANWVYSVYLRRVSGSGNIDIAVDGSTWSTTSITSSWSRFYVYGAAVTNPQFGIRIVTSGDVVEFCCSQLEERSVQFPSSYIPNVSTGSSTRGNCTLDYADDTVISDTDGSWYCEFTPFFGSSIDAHKILFAAQNSSNGTAYLNSGGTVASYDGSSLAQATASLSYLTTARCSGRWATSGTFETYKNGASQGTQSFDGAWPRSAGVFRVGCGSGDAQTLDGCIKKIRIYDDDKGSATVDSWSTNGFPDLQIKTYHHLRHNLG